MSRDLDPRAAAMRSELLFHPQPELLRLDHPAVEVLDPLRRLALEARGVVVVDVVRPAVEHVEQLAVDLDPVEIAWGPRGAQVEQRGRLATLRIVLHQRMRPEMAHPP